MNDEEIAQYLGKLGLLEGYGKIDGDVAVKPSSRLLTLMNNTVEGFDTLYPEIITKGDRFAFLAGYIMAFELLQGHTLTHEEFVDVIKYLTEMIGEFFENVAIN